MKNWLPFLLLAANIGCTAAPSQPALPVIHPKVFSLVDSWISDMISPVVTEFSLDAVRRNRNQFGYDAIRVEDGWIIAGDEEERSSYRYRVLKQHANTYVLEFQNNGGGSFTSRSIITCMLLTRRIEVDGKEQDVQVVRITGHDSRS